MKEPIATERAPGAIGPYSQAIRANGFVFVSGQLPIDPATGEFATGGIEAQTRQSIQNLTEILEKAGCTVRDVVKTSVFLSDIGNFGAMNGVYASYFEGDCPARSAMEVANLPKAALVEIEAIAALPQEQ